MSETFDRLLNSIVTLAIMATLLGAPAFIHFHVMGY